MTSNEYDYYILGLEAALTSLQSSLESYKHSLENYCWSKEDHVDWSACVECLEESINEIQSLINSAAEEDDL